MPALTYQFPTLPGVNQVLQKPISPVGQQNIANAYSKYAGWKQGPQFSTQLEPGQIPTPFDFYVGGVGGYGVKPGTQSSIVQKPFPRPGDNPIPSNWMDVVNQAIAARGNAVAPVATSGPEVLAQRQRKTAQRPQFQFPSYYSPPGL